MSTLISQTTPTLLTLSPPHPNPISTFSFPNKNISKTHLKYPKHPSLKPLTATSLKTVLNTTSPPTSTAPPTLKSRLKSGETLYGIFLCTFSPTIAEIVGLAGYDFVIVDMEHAFGGIPEALSCLRALAATNTPAVIRLPESSAAWAKKALDLGPAGIMFPMIETPDDARNAVSYCRYPPNGIRGAANQIIRASGYGIDAGGYLSSCEEDLLIMCQVESFEAVGKIAEIAAVDGVDCIQTGPTDLSATMGYLWDPGNKKVKETLENAEKEVLRGTENGGAFLCGFAMSHDSPEQLKARGYHMVSGAVDIALFRNAAVEDVKKFKMSFGEEISYEEGQTDEMKDDDEKYWSE